jgi:hypothetical protein
LPSAARDPLVVAFRAAPVVLNNPLVHPYGVVGRSCFGAAGHVVAIEVNVEVESFAPKGGPEERCGR